MKSNSYNPYNRKIGFTQRYLNCDDLIISKTDKEGTIKYVNDTMLRISSCKLPDIIGRNHNIIRHPDMPKSLFKIMWDMLENGEDFYGYIKNITKYGSFYWTFAFVTPDYDEKENMIGYQSERRAPNPKAIVEISCIYQQMRAKENLIGVEETIEWFNDEILKGKSYSTYIHRLQNQY